MQLSDQEVKAIVRKARKLPKDKALTYLYSDFFCSGWFNGTFEDFDEAVLTPFSRDKQSVTPEQVLMENLLSTENEPDCDLNSCD
ncbi:hypothetical protein FCV82_02085 [Vibrio breoganii]|uniref:hypothetical protein n=1 Tax=Vibrio breoganii TaxID=553239 RepID=UPI000C851007|nr:hypothetical protein [Vibrio breoganii]PMN67082.1 hypothetical protein BCT28_03770 [Vibrio breoganii]PMO82941.1 hypothetical protein BCT00_06830 [Vibrio breoganii]TKF90382.1 hypothetical protein FCV82_02085 [Vibrio breoganii]